MSAIRQKMTLYEKVQSNQRGNNSFISPDSITFCILIKLTNCICRDDLAVQASFLVWVNYKQIFSLLHQRAASNRLSEAHTEWLQAQIWSKKWRFAAWSWSDDRERALLTADQRRVGGQSVQLVEKRRAQNVCQSHTLWTGSHPFQSQFRTVCLDGSLPAHTEKWNAIQLNVIYKWLIWINLNCKGFNFTVSEGEEHWALSSLWFAHSSRHCKPTN